MKRRLLACATALVAAATIVTGAAAPAHADEDPNTPPPPGCYYSQLASGGVIVGGYSQCFYNYGVHWAVAECEDGTTRWGEPVEMHEYKQSVATCGDAIFGYTRAVRTWGVFYVQ